jgi:hypothetical protein
MTLSAKLIIQNDSRNVLISTATFLGRQCVLAWKDGEVYAGSEVLKAVLSSGMKYHVVRQSQPAFRRNLPIHAEIASRDSCCHPHAGFMLRYTSTLMMEAIHSYEKWLTFTGVHIVISQKLQFFRRSICLTSCSSVKCCPSHCLKLHCH